MKQSENGALAFFSTTQRRYKGESHLVLGCPYMSLDVLGRPWMNHWQRDVYHILRSISWIGMDDLVEAHVGFNGSDKTLARQGAGSRAAPPPDRYDTRHYPPWFVYGHSSIVIVWTFDRLGMALDPSPPRHCASALSSCSIPLLPVPFLLSLCFRPL